MKHIDPVKKPGPLSEDASSPPAGSAAFTAPDAEKAQRCPIPAVTGGGGQGLVQAAAVRGVGGAP